MGQLAQSAVQPLAPIAPDASDGLVILLLIATGARGTISLLIGFARVVSVAVLLHAQGRHEFECDRMRDAQDNRHPRRRGLPTARSNTALAATFPEHDG